VTIGGAGGARWLPLGQVAFAIALLGWFVIVARRIYDFQDPVARSIFRTDRAHYLDLVTRLPRNLQLVGLTAIFTASAIGPGGLLLRGFRLRWQDAWEQLLFATALGLATYTFAVMALGWLQLYTVPAFLLLLGIGLLLTAGFLVMTIRANSPLRLPRADMVHFEAGTVALMLLVLALAATFYIDLLGALGPEVQFDARWTHLAVPVHYVEHGGFFPIVAVTHMAETGLTPYQEMLYVPLVALGGPIAAKLLHWIDGVLAALAVIYFARSHLRSLRIGLLAALFLVSTPVVSWSMSTGGTDLPAAFFTVLAGHAFLRWRDTQQTGFLLLAAITTGYLIGVKPFAAITVLGLLLGVVWVTRPKPASLLAWRRAFPLMARRVGLVAGAALMMCLPWFARSMQLTGNPVFPALDRQLPSPFWGPIADRYVHYAYLSYGHQHTLLNLFRLPWDTVVHPYQYRSIVGPALLILLPLVVAALLAVHAIRAQLRLLAAFIVLWVVLWYASTAIEVRYLDAVLPFIALILASAALVPFWQGSAAVFLRAVALGIALATVALNSQLLVEFQPVSYRLSIAGRAAIPWGYLYRGGSVQPYVSPPIVDWWNSHLSAERDKVWVDPLYTSYYLYSKPEIFNGESYDSPSYLGEWRLTDSSALQHLRAEHVTYVELTPSEIPTMLRAPIGPYLLPVYVDPSDGRQLFRVAAS